MINDYNSVDDYMLSDEILERRIKTATKKRFSLRKLKNKLMWKVKCSYVCFALACILPFVCIFLLILACTIELLMFIPVIVGCILWPIYLDVLCDKWNVRMFRRLRKITENE